MIDTLGEEGCRAIDGQLQNGGYLANRCEQERTDAQHNCTRLPVASGCVLLSTDVCAEGPDLGGRLQATSWTVELAVK